MNLKRCEMLIEFRVGNFKSFNTAVTFSMVAADLPSPAGLKTNKNVMQIDGDLRLLTSAAIYGANASGKSNLGAALRFMRNFVLNSSKNTQATERIGVECFRLSTETLGRPSLFEIVFRVEGVQYRYGFEVDTERIVSEWLYSVSEAEEVALFEREGDQIDLHQDFREGNGITDKTRNNALFLSVVAQFNGPTALRVLQWFDDFSVISGLNDKDLEDFTIECLEKGEYRQQILNFVKGLDLGIDGIDTRPNHSAGAGFSYTDPHSPTSKVRTEHRVFDDEGQLRVQEEFDMAYHESQGTQKLFALAGPLMDALDMGETLFIDELDARLHPLITFAIIELFQSEEANPHGAQLIFATHGTNLLSSHLFRRDQVWFMEKDRQGATHLYSLAEYQIGEEDPFERDYIQGRFGGVPFLGDLSRMFGEAVHA